MKKKVHQQQVVKIRRLILYFKVVTIAPYSLNKDHGSDIHSIGYNIIIIFKIKE